MRRLVIHVQVKAEDIENARYPLTLVQREIINRLNTDSMMSMAVGVLRESLLSEALHPNDVDTMLAVTQNNCVAGLTVDRNLDIRSRTLDYRYEFILNDFVVMQPKAALVEVSRPPQEIKRRLRTSRS